MKVSVFGGGSGYTPELVKGFLDRAASFSLTELWLADISQERLDVVGGFAQRMVAPAGAPFTVALTTNQRDAIRGASYVTTQLRVGGMHARREDEYLGKRHGLIGQETTGMGGMAKALRTMPVILSIARDMAELAPGAPLVNFTNPAGLVTEALAREAAAEAIVLLKNAAGLLPLDAEKLTSIAAIGENAERAAIMGGGSSYVRPHYAASPLDDISNRVGAAVQVGYELGCPVHRKVPLPDPRWLTTADGARQGLTVHYFAGPDFAGESACDEFIEITDMIWGGFSVPGATSSEFSVRLAGFITPPESGSYVFGLEASGRGRLSVDDMTLIDGWDMETADREQTAEMPMVAGNPYALRVELSFAVESSWRTFRLGCARSVPAGAMADAVALAAQSDAAIVFAGLTGEWESEGFDRPDMELPGRQAELIETVAAANPNTIVVLNTGSPVHMSWIGRVAAVVQAWYPGEEAGNAIADVLFGDVNPSARLPTTFPKRLQGNPAFINYPGENGEVHCGEGIYVGYRYYDKVQLEPLFPFGYSLSYTTFAYRNLTLSATEYGPDDPILVRVVVQNTGTRAGKEVVQLYVRDVESSEMRPQKELKDFAKVALAPGETRTVHFTLNQDALAFYDPVRQRWVAEPGEFEMLVGSSSRDIRLVGHFTLKGDPAT